MIIDFLTFFDFEYLDLVEAFIIHFIKVYCSFKVF